jgi:hypothetical protein
MFFPPMLDSAGNPVPYRVQPYEGDDKKTVTEIVVPRHVTCVFTPGAWMDVHESMIVIFKGPVIAGLYRIFEANLTGKGKVRFGRGSVAEVYPQWWGAHGDKLFGDPATGDDAMYIQAAVNGVSTPPSEVDPGSEGGEFDENSVMTVRLPPPLDYYKIFSPIRIEISRIRIAGSSPGCRSRLIGILPTTR